MGDVSHEFVGNYVIVVWEFVRNSSLIFMYQLAFSSSKFIDFGQVRQPWRKRGKTLGDSLEEWMPVSFSEKFGAFTNFSVFSSSFSIPNIM